MATRPAVAAGNADDHRPHDLRHVDLNLLVVLDALRTTGSVTRAAGRLGMTQSGASRALARLRELLADPLFVTTSRGLSPTPRCRALYTDLDRCLEAVRAVVAAPSFSPASLTGTASLILPDHLSYLAGAALRGRLGAAAPGLSLFIAAFDGTWHERLQSGPWDLAVVPPRGGETDLRARVLPTEPWRVLMRANHPVANSPWDAEAYAACAHGIMAVSGHGPTQVDVALATRGLSRHVAFRATSPLVAALATLESDLLVTTTRGLADDLACRFGLLSRPLPLPLEPLRLHVVWHERHHQQARHVWLRGQVTTALSQVMAAD